MMGPIPAGAPPGDMYETVPSSEPTPIRPAPSSISVPPSNSPSADNRYNPSSKQDSRSASTANRSATAPGFIGPVGYDVQN